MAPPRLGPRRLAIAALVLAAACTGSPTPVGHVVDVREADFRIDASADRAPAGTVTFSITNDSPATHEFVVVRTDDPADGLPIASDGLSVDEDALSSEGELSDVTAWSHRTLSLSLPPGHYVFFCNMEGHYLGGMHGELEVVSHA